MNLWDITGYLLFVAILLLIIVSAYSWYQNQIIKAYSKDCPKHEMFDDFIEPKWR